MINQPPCTTGNKIPLNEVICIICGETSHWEKNCVNVHPEFKEAKVKCEAASVSNSRKLVDDLFRHIQLYKALSKANSDADSEDESEGGRNFEGKDGNIAGSKPHPPFFVCL